MQKKQIKNHNITNKNNLYDISKKSLIGAFLFILLSIPPVQDLFNTYLPAECIFVQYKNIILKGIIFSILFVLISKYI